MNSPHKKTFKKRNSDTKTQKKTRKKKDPSAAGDEDASSVGFLTSPQVSMLTDLTTEEVQKELQDILSMKNHLVCLKEASVLDYYVSGFWWAKESSFSPEQIQAFMSLLQILMENLRTKRMTIADNLRELAAAMKEVSRSEADENDGPELFSLDESTCIIDFLKGSLFQHYKLYEFVFIHSRDDLFLRFQENIDVDLFINSLHAHPLEEGLSQDMYSLFIDVGTPEQPEEETLPEEQKFDYVIETPTRDPLEGFTVEDVKQVLQNITGSVVKNLQSEINKKLQQQEEDYLARLEKVIRS